MARGRTDIQTLAQAMEGLPQDFAFFADRFPADVQPRLVAREDDRVAAVKKQTQMTIAAVLFAIVSTAGVFLFFPEEPWGLIIGLVGGFGLYAWGSTDINRLAKETKLMLVDPVASQFGMAYQGNPPTPPAINTARAMGLVPGWDRASYEDQLTGRRGDAPFVFFEAHLEEKRTTTDSKGRTRTTWVTVFRGQCLSVKFMKEFKGVTKVFRDMGMFNMFGRMGAGLPHVKLEDPVFEKCFEVFSDDQIESRFILTPDFMERLLKLEKTFEGKQLRCAFVGGEMLLCVEGKNLLEPGSMRRRMDDLNRVAEMLQDFAAIFLLIDAMSQRMTPEALRSTPVG